MKEGDLPVEEQTLPGGASVRVVTVPEDTIGRAVVIVVKETRDSRNGVSGTVNMAGDLPIWEQNVSVEVPEGTEIFWSGREMREPTESMSGGSVKYSWQVMNQLPWRGEGFVVNERPMLSFSTNVGVLAEYARRTSLPHPCRSCPCPQASAATRARRADGLSRGSTLRSARSRAIRGMGARQGRNPSRRPVDAVGAGLPASQMANGARLEFQDLVERKDVRRRLEPRGGPPSLKARCSSSRPPALRAPRTLRLGYHIHPGACRFRSRARSSTATAKKSTRLKSSPTAQPSASRLALLWRLKLAADGRPRASLR